MNLARFLPHKADLWPPLRPAADPDIEFADLLPEEDDGPWLPTVPNVLEEQPPIGCTIIDNCPRYDLERELVELEWIRAHAKQLAYAAAVRAWENKGGDWT